MPDDDITFMKRAIELAQRGAGLVSPNPMVGAVLVKEGRVVGEGFHRYDKLRHAESYAIEKAGGLARGATLYCSLEPCCHYGRTPPCTDALIEAGIARAVIAVIDPNPRVSGRGIEQLRSAAVTVDVGLCESESVRLNEFYFKYITRRLPFIHAVIERCDETPASQSAWQPSARFLEMVCACDGVALGYEAKLNRLIIEAFSQKKRHRPLIVVGTPATLSSPGLRAAIESAVGDATLISMADDSGLAACGLPATQKKIIEPRFDSALQSLAELRATSVVMLPGSFEICGSAALQQIDKLTIVVSRDEREYDSRQLSARDDLASGLNCLEASVTQRHIEFTGYPRASKPGSF